MRVTAAVLEQPGQPLVLRDVELGPPRPDEVLVRLSAVGVCATDLEFATFFEAPAVFGHEAPASSSGPATRSPRSPPATTWRCRSPPAATAYPA